ncbi:acyl-CoA dehydrogenase family protein [Maricaulis sp. CAU 1757]
MDFTPTDDRRMISDSLRRFLADNCTAEHRNRYAYEAPFHDPEIWAGLAELGILGALVGEEQGGFGGAGFDITTVFEELGRALCPEPVLANLMALRLYAAVGHQDRIDAVIAGTSRAALAIDSADWGPGQGHPGIEVDGDGDTVRLTGRRTVVYGAPAADFILVPVEDSSGAVHLFEVAGADAEILGYAMIDGGGAAEIMLNASSATRLGDNAATAVAEALDAGRLALCAEAVGAMEVLRDTTRDYLMQRQQFGRPIATFQALQHRLVDLAIEIEQARSITIHAAGNFGTAERGLAVAKAKNLIGRAGRLVAEEAIQMHGGIGMTWEYAASHYAKRLVMIDHQLGDADDHLHRVIELTRASAA